ncbi:CFA54 protein, partial [Neodrepanis coruscans]|nr:CFA54 protein [Neodrepanis coruscans]
ESRASANASDKEINIQWYIPSLVKPPNDTGTKVLLLYAYNTEPVQISNIEIFSSMSVFSGHLWIPLAGIISLRKKLSNLKEQVEILMQSSRSLSSASEATGFREQTYWRRPIVQHLFGFFFVVLYHQEMAKRCLSEVKALLSAVPALSSPLTEV